MLVVDRIYVDGIYLLVYTTYIKTTPERLWPEQRVLVSEPYWRLSYTWHTFTPEWAKATGIDDEVLATIREEPRSKVSFDIEPHGELVKLTVVHDDFEPGSTVLEMVSEGWPRLLSDLKTLPETDDILPAGAHPE